MKQIVYIGTYTDQPDMPEKRSEGIFIYNLDTEAKTLEKIGAVPDSPNPSFLALTNDQQILIAANELSSGPGQVTAYNVDTATGMLTYINQQPSEGDGPCYVSIHPSGRWALVANYNSGTAAVLPMDENGVLGEAVSVIRHTGSGPVPERQDGPHAHSIVLDPTQQLALIADLGIDKITLHKFNSETGKLETHKPAAIEATPKGGPRHTAFSPDERFLALTNELSSTVSMFEYDAQAGTFKKLQELSTIPEDFTGENSAAHLVFASSGRFLYTSNRGHDSIAIFKIDEESGQLTLAHHVSVEGKKPRHFSIDPSGKFLLVANQDSETVTLFHVDADTGFLTFTGTRIELPRPVFVGYLANNA
jgi:6-phosphogluconolactonase